MKSGCIRAKKVVFGQGGCVRAKWLYSHKVVAFGKSGCIWAYWLFSGKVFFRRRLLYLGKVVVIGQNRLYSGKSGPNRTKWLNSDKIDIFGQNSCNRATVVVFGQSGCIWAK